MNGLFRILAAIFSPLFLLGAIIAWEEEIKDNIQWNHSMMFFCSSIVWSILLAIYAVRGKLTK